MRRWIAALSVAAVLAACGSGDKDPRGTDRSKDEPGAERTASRQAASGQPRSSEVADAAALLASSARKGAKVQSMRGEFTMDMRFGGVSFDFDGEMAFRAPDQIYMTMEMFNQDFEILVYGSNFYMKVPGGGWRTLDLSSAGINLDQFKKLTEERGLFDVEGLTETFGDELEQLDDEEIDGELYLHFHGEADSLDFAERLPDGFLDPALLEQVQGSFEGMEFDIFIDPQTELMRRTSFSMDMDIPDAGRGGIEMLMDVLEYDGPVEIPDEPVGAPVFDPAELAGG